MANWGSTWFLLAGLIFALILAWWIWMETKFKNRVTIKDVVNGRVIIKNYRARFYEDKDKSAWWRLSGEKEQAKKFIPIPPEECIEIDYKARKHVQAYRFETGETVFIKDDWQPKTLPSFKVPPKNIQVKIDNEKDPQKRKNMLDKWGKEALAQWKKDNKAIAPYQPVTTNQRMAYFNNIKKAESRKTFDWKTQIIPIAAMSGIVIIVLALIVMFGEIAQPVLEADKISNNQFKMQKEIVTILKDIKLNQQTIKGDVDRINQVIDDTNNGVPD